MNEVAPLPERRTKFPLLTLLSAVLAPLFAICSIPILSAWLKYQVASEEYNSEAAKITTQQFAGFALIAGIYACAFYGSVAGVASAVAGHIRREGLLWLRVLSLVVNGVLVSAGAYWFWLRPWLLTR